MALRVFDGWHPYRFSEVGVQWCPVDCESMLCCTSVTFYMAFCAVVATGAIAFLAVASYRAMEK